MHKGVIPPIFAAIYGFKVHSVKLLISRNADIELRNRAGYTPLMEAAKRGHFSMVKVLLEAGMQIQLFVFDIYSAKLSNAFSMGPEFQTLK